MKKTASHVKVYTVNKEPEWGGMEEFFVHSKGWPGIQKESSLSCSRVAAAAVWLSSKWTRLYACSVRPSKMKAAELLGLIFGVVIGLLEVLKKASASTMGAGPCLSWR